MWTVLWSKSNISHTLIAVPASCTCITLSLTAYMCALTFIECYMIEHMLFLRKNGGQKKRARRISTETRSSVPSGQFLLWKEEWALAKSLSLEY